MLKPHLFLAASLMVPALYLTPLLRADDTSTVGGIAPRAIVDIPAAGSESKFVADEPASHGQVTISRNDTPPAVVVTIAPGEAGYPGVSLKPEAGLTWDFSPFGHIEATITNTGTKQIGLGLRVDDSGGYQNNNATVAYIKPGETQVVKVIFGYSFGNPSSMIKTSSIAQILLFGGKSTAEAPESFRIESIEAAGVAGEKLPVKAGSIVIVPKDGLLLGAGADKLDPSKNLVSKGGAAGTLVDASGAQTLKIDFTGSAQSAGVKPDNGKWALYNGIEVRAKLRNDGSSPVTPTLHVDSQGGPIDATADAPLAPGAETELVVPYANPKIWRNTPPSLNPDPGTGNKFTSQQVTAVLIGTAAGSGAGTLTVESLKADCPPYSAPEWLGTKPPEDGDWTKTLDDEFDGTSIDETKWNLVTDNYWDKRTHFTREETTVSGGFATLHFEKKPGVPGNNPSKPPTDYASGYLDTFGKWVQRYGYFESRMKVPSAPGLWPAFWLMPDRGVAAGEQWKRSDTANGGMEFDIMEFLSGWGPCRYNIAMHWDGYGKSHKSTGSDRNYVQPDKDGFITSGLLWLPGKAIYYCNGKEILHYENERVSTVPSFVMYDFVSGGWDNRPLEDAKLPDTLVIDYVRCWQRKDLASPVDGFKAPDGSPAPPAK